MKQILFGILFTLFSMAAALAHSPLSSTAPEDKAQLASVPDGIALNFAKPARVTKVTLTHTHGEAAHTDKLEIPSKSFEKSFDLSAQFRGAGSYLVEWRALGEDGHVLKGSFGFTVQGN